MSRTIIRKGTVPGFLLPGMVFQVGRAPAIRCCSDSRSGVPDGDARFVVPGVEDLYIPKQRALQWSLTEDFVMPEGDDRQPLDPQPVTHPCGHPRQVFRVPGSEDAWLPCATCSVQGYWYLSAARTGGRGVIRLERAQYVLPEDAAPLVGGPSLWLWGRG